MSIEALIFDVDGTLADTEEAHRQAFNAAFLRLELGWEWTPTQYAVLLAVAGGRERIAHYIDSLAVPASEKARLVALVPSIHRLKTQLYAGLIADPGAPLRPGIERLVGEAAAAGVKVAIASTTSGSNIDALLGSKGRDKLRARIKVVACADQVPIKKPAPDVYLHALGLLGLPAEACVAFEDSENGLRSAQAAGLFTVVTPNAWSAHQVLNRADLLLPHLGDPHEPLGQRESSVVGGAYLGLKELGALHARWSVSRQHFSKAGTGSSR